nr:site-specific integrase [uncultured Dysosmobacter sp.]
MAEKQKKKYAYLTKAVQLPDGTRKYLRAKTQKELDEKVLKTQILVNSGVDICNEETFAHFAQMWYDLYKKPYLRENSLEAIKYVLNQHILPVIGGYRLRDITPMQIQAIMAGLAGKSNSLQSKVLINLRSIFKAAQENGLVAKSPVSSMLKPSGKKTVEKEALNAQERQLLLEWVKNPRARTFLLIALHTGMRRGEIVGLQWEDIDFKKKVIHVRHNAVMGRYETTISENMKTKAGKRNLPLSEDLEEWLVARKKTSHSKYVIAMENHGPLTKSSYKSMWKLIERELPDTHITAHILRHTYITQLFESGTLDVKEIQYLAGHSTMDMTLRVYTHYDRRTREAKTAEKVREALRVQA